MSYTLYTYANSYRANKALVAAAYGNVKINVPSDFQFGVTNKTEKFLKLNPLGKVPTLETPEGGLYESNAIARYVARLAPTANLFGKSVYEASQVDQWIDWCALELETPRGQWIYPAQGFFPFDQAGYEKGKAAVTKAMDHLNNHLNTRTFLVGEAVTVADIVIVNALVDCYSMIFSPEFIAPFVNVNRWFNTCVNQPQFAGVIGKVTFAKAETFAKGNPLAPKEEKKVDTAALEAAIAAEEAEKKKQKSALDLLPPSKFILDAIKRQTFSKKPINEEVFATLTADWEPEGWSFWHCGYKYNDENKVDYMVSNMVSGFIQRSDAVRKYAMGVMVVTTEVEDQPPFNVSGAWFFRGPTVPAEMMSENPDAEYFEWTKVDFPSAEGEAMLKELFLGDSVKGQTVVERKFFK